MSNDIETLKAIAKIAVEALGALKEPINSQPAAHSIKSDAFKALLDGFGVKYDFTNIIVHVDTWAAGLLKEHDQHIDLQRQTISSLRSANESLAARNIHSQNTILALTGSEGRAVRARDHLRRNYAALKQQLAEADQANSEAHAMILGLKEHIQKIERELREATDHLDNWNEYLSSVTLDGTVPERSKAPAGQCERGERCLCIAENAPIIRKCGWWIES